MNYSQIIKKLDSNKISPLYLLVGEEDYLIRELLDHFIRVIVPPVEKDFNLEILDAGVVSGARLKDAMGTLPFLGGKRLVIVKNLQDIKEKVLESGITRNFEKPDPAIVIVLTATSLGKKRKLQNLLKKHAEIVEIKKLSKGETGAWISKTAQSMGKTIDNDAKNYLIQRVGTNLGNLHNELEKAFAFVGDRPKIRISDLNELVGDLQIDSIFSLTDAVGAKDLDTALKSLKNIMAHGAHPLVILGMLARQFRMIWQTKSLAENKVPSTQIAQTVGIPPFLISKLIQQSKRFTEMELSLTFERMKSLDKSLKSIDAPPGILLEKLIFDFCNS